MDPDRWRRIEVLYEAAQALAADERAVFLSEACSGDDSLRREVELLLAQGGSGEAFFAGGAAAAAAMMTDPVTPAPAGMRGVEAVAADLTGSTIGGRFVIRARLGKGGMGEVYLAYDTQLKRTVAIKRMAPSRQSQNPATELLKEAQKASGLNHPRIASVYDVFAMGSELLLVMEYLDGITLRQRIMQPMGLADFCAIAVQCTEALSAAHAKGIMHGDIKPANIMLTRDGSVKICDFGLARRLQTGDVSGDTTSVHRGIAGTPAYLAPEVVHEQSVDERADIFSLGVVFYEMLAGRNPFATRHVVATLDRVLNHAPEPIDRAAPFVPARLARVVHRMLEKDPRERYATAAEVGEALSSISAQHSRADTRRQLVARMRAWGALAAAAAFVAFSVPRDPDALPGSAMPQEINLAVLPFIATGAAGDRQYFTEGLTESLNEQLSRLTVNRRFQVATLADRRARNVTNPMEAREQLGANVALSGSLQYSGTVVQVTSRLIDTRSGLQLRSETFTADVSNPLSVEAGVIETVVRMMGIDFGPARQRLLGANATVKPGARDYYLQARGYLLNYDRIESVDSAIAVFRKALDVDARYALAYAGLGQAYWRKHELTGSAAWAEPARGACEGALGIDAALAEPHACLGMVLNGTGEYERAVEAFSRALEREPTNDLAYLGLATAYERLGRHTDAERTFLRAIELRPHYWALYNNLGAYYYRLGRHDDALAMFQQAVALAPDSFRAYSSVGAVQFMLDRTGEAIAAFQKSLAIRPNYAAASNLATLYYFEEEFALAADHFRQALSFDQSSYQVWGNFAQTLVQAGQKEEAEAAYRRARELVTERLDVNSRNAALQFALAEYSAALGEMDKARAAFSAALALAPDDAHTLFQIGVFYESRLNARDEALKWLTRAVERGQTWREIDRAPELRDLRTDPRFQELRRPR